MDIIRIPANDPDYKSLSNIYEREFSPLTGAQADENGEYPISTLLDEFRVGYFITHENKQVGFIVIDIEKEPFDICELFVLKEFRKRHLASRLIKGVLDLHKGAWQVKQLFNAPEAHRFWLRFLSGFVDFHEDIYDDKKWGKVYRQTFTV